jgi:multidrug resistance efflux pump
MNSSGFKRNKSALTIEQEVTPVKPGVNAGRIIYLVILLGLVVFAGFYFYNRIFFIRADGQVIFKNVDIRLTENSRILSFFRTEGDSVRKGDTLFSYMSKPGIDPKAAYLSAALDSSVSSYDNAKNRELINWFERELFNYRTCIQTNQIQYRSMAKLLKEKKNELKKIENLTVLEAIPRSHYENAISDTLELSIQLEKLSAENANLNQLAAVMTDRLGAYKDLYDEQTRKELTALFDEKNGQVSQSTPQYFLSPLDGFINNIYLSEYETATMQDNILSIQQPSQIFIRAYFDQEDIAELKEDAVVTLTFPDKKKSKGYIKRFYYGTYTLPQEFQKKYETARRSVAADIYPLNDDESQRWKLFHKLSVKVSFYKF